MSIKEREETSDVLRRAAQVLRSSGWCRYELGPARCDAGPHCALGAIYCVADRNSTTTERARVKLATFLIEKRGVNWYQSSSRMISNWNDRLVNDADQVIAALEEAAEAV